MDNAANARFFSEEQMVALVLIERHGLMGIPSISERFNIDPELFSQWRERFRHWMPYHAPTVHWLEVTHANLRRWLPKNMRRCRSDSVVELPRKFCEEQIAAMLGLITHGLATPDDVAQRFGVEKAQLFNWWTSRFTRTAEDFDEICRLERENKKLKAMLKKHGIDPSGEV